MPLTALLYLILLSTSVIVYLTRYHDPTLLVGLTREDGPVEWATVLALVAFSALLFHWMRKLRSRISGRLRIAGYGLAVLALLAAGEEISWGQRLFGFETGETMKKLNHQQEMNLHNLLPGELFNGLIIFAVGLYMIALPMVWRAWKKGPEPWWLPSKELSLLTLATILVNHYRVTSLPEKAGLVILGLLLVAATIQAIAQKHPRHLAACLIGWLTGGVLYHCRDVLRAANMQYEIRELLVILLAVRYCAEALEKLERCGSVK